MYNWYCCRAFCLCCGELKGGTLEAMKKIGLATLLFQLSSAEVDANDQPLLDGITCSCDYFQQIMVHSIDNIHNHCVIRMCRSLLLCVSGGKSSRCTGAMSEIASNVRYKASTQLVTSYMVVSMISSLFIDKCITNYRGPTLFLPLPHCVLILKKVLHLTPYISQK